MFYDFLYEYASIVQSESMRSAARRLGIAQPTLGRHVSALETQLGQPLLDRNGSGVRPTIAGRSILEKARSVMDIEDGIRLHFSDPSLHQGERLLFVGGHALTKAAQEAFLVAARDTAKPGSVVLPRFCPDSESGVDLVVRGMLDVVAVFGPELRQKDSRGLASISFPAVHLAVSVTHEDPLCHRGSLSIYEIGNTPISRDWQPGSKGECVWEAFRALSITLGLCPMLSDNRNGLLGSAPDRRLVMLDGSPVRHGSGTTLIPLCDLDLPVFLYVRADDEAARHLALAAAEMAIGETGVRHPSDTRAVDTSGTPAPAVSFPPSTDLGPEPQPDADLVLPDGVSVDKTYVRLRNRLNRLGNGLNNEPTSHSFEAVLALWTLEEARLELDMPLFDFVDARTLARHAGKSEDACRTLLGRMADKGLLYHVSRGGRELYRPLSWSLGVRESQIREHGWSSNRFLELGIYGSDEESSSEIPTMVVAPVAPRDVTGDPLETWSDWESCLIGHECFGIVHQCSRPIEADDNTAGPTPCNNAVCIVLGELAEYWTDIGAARPADMEECLMLAKRATRELELVPWLHFSRNPEIVCFLGPRWCKALAAGSGPEPTGCQLAIDKSRCTNCGVCAAVCPMGSASPASAGPDCLSCGKCAVTCPTGARAVHHAIEKEAPRPADFMEADAWRTFNRAAARKIRDFTGDRIMPW